jgi:uncharacterized protein DUF6056
MRSRVLVAIGCAVLLVPLVAHAWAGTASRYVGDDYCAGYIFHDWGFIGGQRWFYTRWGAVPTTVLLIALTNPLGVSVSPVLTAIALSLWVAALAWTIARLLASTHAVVSRLVPLLVAELIVFATLHDAPNVIQSVYLRVPLFEYIVPLVLLTIGIGVLARRGERAPGGVALASWAIFAFVAGNFGPTYAALQTTACGLALAVNRVAFARSVRVERLLAAATAGSIAALALIAMAPGNAARQAYFPPPPGPFGIAKWTVLSTVFMFARPALPLLRSTIVAVVPHVVSPTPAWLQTALAMNASPLTIVLLVGIPLWIAVLDGGPERAAPHRGDTTAPLRDDAGVAPALQARGLFARRALVWLPIVAVVLVLACMAPSAYGTSSPPPPRTLVIPQFVIASLLAAWSYALGMTLRGTAIVASPFWKAALVVVATLAIVAPARSAAATFVQAQELRAWARRWDETDRALRAAAAERRAAVEVPAVGSIGAVGSIAIDPNDWVNACAARYYGLQQIAGRAQP